MGDYNIGTVSPKEQIHDLNIITAKRLGWGIKSEEGFFCLVDNHGNEHGCSPYKHEVWDWVRDYCNKTEYALALIKNKDFKIEHSINCFVVWEETYTVTIEFEGDKATVTDKSLPLAIVRCWNKMYDIAEGENGN